VNFGGRCPLGETKAALGGFFILNPIRLGNVCSVSPFGPQARYNVGSNPPPFSYSSQRKLSLLRLFPKVFSGNHISDPVVDYRQVSEFSILTEDQNSLNIDGEMLGSTPIRVTMMPKEIEVLV